ncbi:MAG TPA: DUF6588 family protein [Candidatus Krumholzibacteria bacterium]|nr:DUF6588 family protein [Candidatus Krumholzibacteria bacterium]
MRHHRLSWPWTGALAIACVCLPVASSAQLAVNLSNYDAENAIGYTAPVRSALVAGLGNGLFATGLVRTEQTFVARASVQYLRISFRDEDREFRARGPLGLPAQLPAQQDGFGAKTPLPVERDAPSIVGSTESVEMVVDLATTEQAVRLPGGFDLDGLAVTAPQLTLGYRGHEAVVRFSDVNSGTAELGDLRIFGLGLRSDVTRYLDEDLPVRVAFMGAYQSVEFADGLMDATLWTAGLQVGRRFGRGEVYSAVTFDTIDFGLDYEGPDGGRVDASETESRPRVTLGGGVALPLAHLNAELSFNDFFSVAVGVALGL